MSSQVEQKMTNRIYSACAEKMDFPILLWTSLFQIQMCVVRKIEQWLEFILWSAKNCIQYLVINHNGKEF